jgi:hypothetical protein
MAMMFPLSAVSCAAKNRFGAGRFRDEAGNINYSAIASKKKFFDKSRVGLV